MLVIKLITKEQINELIERKIIRNSHDGYVDSKGEHIGYYRTLGAAKKRYIEDYYVNVLSRN